MSAVSDIGVQSQPGDTDAQPGEWRRSQAGARALLAVVLLAGSFAAYARLTNFPDIVAVELGGSGQLPWPVDDPAALRDALRWDVLLIAGYASGLSLLCDLGRRIFWTARARQVARVATAASLLAAAAAAATGKFCLLALAIGTAAVALAVTALRVCVTGRPAALERRRTDVPPPGSPPDGSRFFVRTLPAPALDPEPRPPIGTGHAVVSPTARDRRAWAWSVPGLYPAELATRRATTPVVDFCVSGGGIRSASVTLGALQGLRSRLIRARYLTSVSGGGYTVGALQMALQPLPADAPEGDRSSACPADVLLAGSVEEDHLRRHSNYLADSAGQWVTALAVVLRGVLASLVLVTSAVAVTGLLLGFAYAAVPLTPGLGAFAPNTGNAAVQGFPELGQGVLAALAVLAVVAVAAYLASLVALAATGSWSARTSALARNAVGVTALSGSVCRRWSGPARPCWPGPTGTRFLRLVSGARAPCCSATRPLWPAWCGASARRWARSWAASARTGRPGPRRSRAASCSGCSYWLCCWCWPPPSSWCSAT